jgi:hypothetical protein
VAELIVLADVVAMVVLVVWAVVGATARRRSSQEQPDTTGTTPIPPVEPAVTIPGSRTRRRAQGKP